MLRLPIVLVCWCRSGFFTRRRFLASRHFFGGRDFFPGHSNFRGNVFPACLRRFHNRCLGRAFFGRDF